MNDNRRTTACEVDATVVKDYAYNPRGLFRCCFKYLFDHANDPVPAHRSIVVDCCNKRLVVRNGVWHWSRWAGPEQPLQ